MTPLQEERERRGWKKAEAARACGCDKSTYGRIESGEYKPSAHLAARIVLAFGRNVTLEQIQYPFGLEAESAARLAKGDAA